jgi:hypothetical protein
MPAVRHINGSTNNNVARLIQVIHDGGTVRVILFASPTTSTDDMHHSDGPETNLPLLSAVAEYGSLSLEVFDGIFLTAARMPRYYEIKELLDVAETSNKVYFSTVRAPFTSNLPPAVAAKIMLDSKQFEPLTPTTRPKFFTLLSSITEKELQTL